MVSLLSVSCSDVIEQYETEASNSQLMNRDLTSEDETKYAEEGEPTVLGEQLPIPYTIENMMAAYKSLLAEPKAEGNRSLTAVKYSALHTNTLNSIRQRKMNWKHYNNPILFFMIIHLIKSIGGR